MLQGKLEMFFKYLALKSVVPTQKGGMWTSNLSKSLPREHAENMEVGLSGHVCCALYHKERLSATNKAAFGELDSQLLKQQKCL